MVPAGSTASGTVNQQTFSFSEKPMIRFRKYLPLGAVLVAAAILGAPAQSQAAFTLTLQQTGFTDVVVTDNVGDDVNPIAGQITYVKTFGTWTTNINAASSNSSLAVDPAHLQGTNLNVTGTAGSTLAVILEDTAFTVPPLGPATMLSELSNTQTPLGNADLTYQSFINGVGGTVLVQNGVAGSVKTGDPVIIPTSPYTIKSVITIALAGAGSVNTTGITEVTAVPAPAGVVLALAGMPCLAVASWLRRRKKA
jgi:hypothetical protein